MKPICYDNYYWQNDLVRLRAMQPEDWEECYRYRFDSDSRLFQKAQIELPPTIKEEKENTEKFSNFNADKGKIIFVIETLDEVNVGSINIKEINERNGTFSIGIQINKEWRCKGYATAAMQILLRYAFFERRLNKYNGVCLEGNISSIAMHKKLNCIQEGIRRQQIYSGGRYLDVIFFGLTKEEFINSN